LQPKLASEDQIVSYDLANSRVTVVRQAFRTPIYRIYDTFGGWRDVE